ncbi:MAG: UDP-N-acetylmuramate dehydrogenase [Candidatus Paceibacterota bacterium]|jgi:UDP-N-acetylmuramate dehydrogenase
MNLRENVPLAPLTTLGAGGAAKFFIHAQTEKDIDDALACAEVKGLSVWVLGNGSNILVPDAGVEDVVLKMALDGIAFEAADDETLLVAGAGTPWEEVVDVAGAHDLFGIENLAGIPGTVGGAAVQNIGAYGAELADVFEYVDGIDGVTGEHKQVARAEAAFAYRTSVFKKHRAYIVTRVALRLSKHAKPNLAYPDLTRARERGVPLSTPSEIARAVRAIRADKFPRIAAEGTAGSFFKNPLISRELADSLAERFDGLPVFLQENGRAKISLAWLLDHALALKGFAKGRVRLYEKQPLVIVVRAGATAKEIDSFANEIAEKVFSATGIRIEREVETFGAQKEI